MDKLGLIDVPNIVPTGTFPVTPDYPFGVAENPSVFVHRFGMAQSARTEQRFYMGNGARTFTVHRNKLTGQERLSFIDFWESNSGAYGAFTFNVPSLEGVTGPPGAQSWRTSEFKPTICHFASQTLSLEYALGCITSLGLQLKEIPDPSKAPTYPLAQTVTRFPTDALNTALLDQVQQIIPLIMIQPLDQTYPALLIADRRATIGERLYLPRLVDWDGISQTLGNASDEAQFQFGNADRVMRQIVNQVDLFRARLEFSLFHVGTGIKIDLWAGQIVRWHFDAGPIFRVTAADGIYEINLPYPTRKITRWCDKLYNVAGTGCDWATRSGTVTGSRTITDGRGTRTFTFSPDASKCDKSLDGPNGCLAHFMEDRFHGIVAEPQSVQTKDNSTGVIGFGRNSLTSLSLIADSIYDQVLPEVWCSVVGGTAWKDAHNIHLVSGASKDSITITIGGLGSGTILAGDQIGLIHFDATPKSGGATGYTVYTITADTTVTGGVATIQITPGLLDDVKSNQAVSDESNALGMPVNCKLSAGRDEGDFFTGIGIVCEGPIGAYAQPSQFSDPYFLDGQHNHGWNVNNYGLRRSYGHDPVQDNDPDGASQWFSLGEGGSGPQYYSWEKAAGVAFVEIRRTDAPGLQLSTPDQHHMEVSVRQGMYGYTWNGPGDRSELTPGLNNPVWIVINMLLRARGVWFADVATQEFYFDVQAAIDAAAICDLKVPAILGSLGDETQFSFAGIFQEEKPLRDWISEVLNNCLGYSVFSFGKLRIGIRENSSVVAAGPFTEGNIIFQSLSLDPVRPAFNYLTGQYADKAFGFVANSVSIGDDDNALALGGNSGAPLRLRATLSLSGSGTVSQTARIITTRLREELGGINSDQWKAARQVGFKSTILSLGVECGMICSLTHPDMPDYPQTVAPPGDPNYQDAIPTYGEFRLQNWKLLKDYSIELLGKTTHNDVYDLVYGPKPQDTPPTPIAVEDLFAPDRVSWHVGTAGDGNLVFDRFACGANSRAVHSAIFEVYYIDEQTCRYGTVFSSIDDTVTTFVYFGTMPVIGEWIMADAEIMEIVDATDRVGSGTVTVIRGALGTVATPHSRIITTISAVGLWPAQLAVDPGINLRPGSRLVLDDGTDGFGHAYDDTHPAPQQPIGLYDNASGVTITALPLAGAQAGKTVYSDVRLWRVSRRDVVIPLQPGFFQTAPRAEFHTDIVFPFAGVVMVRGKFENTRGLQSRQLTALPAGPHSIEINDPATFTPDWPYRIRTLGTTRYHLEYSNAALGDLPTTFTDAVVAHPECLEFAYMELSGVSPQTVDSPTAITTVVPADLLGTGTVTLAGTVSPAVLIQVSVSGANELAAPTFVAADRGVAAGTPISFVVNSLADWLNSDDHFAAFYSASGAGSVMTITDLLGHGGTVTVDITGGMTAAAAGFTSRMGVLVGRKYATAFTGGGLTSALSALSPSTGPTGDAQKIIIRGLPVSSDTRVSDVLIFATTDGGADDDLHSVGTVPNGTDAFDDTTIEASLGGGFGGENQPTTGDVLATIEKDGDDWFQLYISAGTAQSFAQHGFALDPIDVDASINASIVNNAGDQADISIVIQ
jgi:hypothetical protein